MYEPHTVQKHINNLAQRFPCQLKFFDKSEIVAIKRQKKLKNIIYSKGKLL